MIILRYFVPFAVFAFFAFDILISFGKYIEQTADTILTTPHGLVLLPVTLFVPGGVVYFTPTEIAPTQAVSLQAWIFSISPHIATMFIYQVTAVFIYFYARVQRIERAYIIFAFSLSFYFLFFLDYVSDFYVRIYVALLVFWRNPSNYNGNWHSILFGYCEDNIF